MASNDPWTSPTAESEHAPGPQLGYWGSLLIAVGTVGMMVLSGLSPVIIFPISWVMTLAGTILCGIDQRWHEDQFLRVMCRFGSFAVLIGLLLLLSIFAVWSLQT